MVKAITFSILTFIFAGSLFLIISIFLTLQEIFIEKTVIERDVEFMLNTLEFIKNDFSNFLEISIPRILNSIISYEIENGVFVNDVKELIKTILFEKTFFDEKYLVRNTNLKDYENRIRNFLSIYDVNISIRPISFDVYHLDSFKIFVNLSLQINITHKNKLMSSIEIVKKNISILGMEDPFYVINSKGLASNYIKTKKIDFFVKKDVIGNGSGTVSAKTIILFDRNSILNLPNKKEYILVTNNDSQISTIINQFAGVILERNMSLILIPHVIGKISNVTNNTYYLIKNGVAYNIQSLKDTIDNQLCFESSDGATFLDRLEGRNKLSGKYNFIDNVGIECFVNKNYLLLSGLSINYTKTNIDYLYFSEEFPTSYKVSGFDNFYIDAMHVQKYQLQEIVE